MLTFKMFLEDEKGVVSFDFDGVLHHSLVPGTTHPMSYWNWEMWEPNKEIFKKIKEEAANHRIVVVSKRDDPHQKPMWDFIHAYHLPIEQIYTTNNGPKRQILEQLGAIRHYDDDPRMAQELHGTNIQFIKVDPILSL